VELSKGRKGGPIPVKVPPDYISEDILRQSSDACVEEQRGSSV
jgi:hypothetical protein